MTDVEPSFACGDFVELTSGEWIGRRGFIEGSYEGVAGEELYVVVVEPKLPCCLIYREAFLEQDIKVLRKHGQLITTRICDYVSESFACHGVPASHTIDRPIQIDPESAYGRLRRRPIEELRSPALEELAAEKTDLADIFRNVFEGQNLVVEWSHRFDDGLSLRQASPHYEFQVRLDNSQEVLASIDADPRDQLTWKSQCPGWDEMSPGQARALVSRVLHLFLRVAGCDMNIGTLSSLFTCLRETYITEHSWWNENLDLVIIFTDSKAQIYKSDRLAPIDFSDVAHAHGDCGKFSRAVEVSAQGIESIALMTEDEVADPHMDSKRFTITLWKLQARAFLCAGVYEKALECCLHRMMLCFQGVDGDQSVIDSCVRETWDLIESTYSAWYHCSDGGIQILELFCLLKAMVQKSRYLGPSCLGESSDSSNILPLARRYYVRGPSAAQAALKRAFRSDSVTSFHLCVERWKQPGWEAPSIAKDPDRHSPPSWTRLRDDIRRVEQDAVIKCRCSNLLCQDYDVRKLRNCIGCRSVRYCSKACQKKHWPEHRAECRRIQADLAQHQP